MIFYRKGQRGADKKGNPIMYDLEDQGFFQGGGALQLSDVITKYQVDWFQEINEVWIVKDMQSWSNLQTMSQISTQDVTLGHWIFEIDASVAFFWAQQKSCRNVSTPQFFQVFRVDHIIRASQRGISGASSIDIVVQVA